MGKFSFDNVNSMYIDVLKEIGNIGAGNATTAIASMLYLTIDMKVPKVELRAVEDRHEDKGESRGDAAHGHNGGDDAPHEEGHNQGDNLAGKGNLRRKRCVT